MLNQQELLDAARERAGLDDFGNDWFLNPMAAFLASLNGEARLTQAGIAAQREVIVKGLVSRLRLTADLKTFPEILEEQVEVAGIILGLPRTGSTIFHRLLASAPGMTAIKWWECQNYAPFPHEERGKPVERRAYAETMLAGWLSVAPDLLSIHPMDIDGPDEEILILGQMFVSTMLEGMSFVPGFTRWLDDYDQSRGHEDLITILKYLQWQAPERRGCKWVLKSPSNLPYARYAAKAFPDALLIMTHRDPVAVIPSYISMEQTLYAMTSDVPVRAIADFWFGRLQNWLTAFATTRAEIGEARFIDIDYARVIAEPVAEATRVLERMGIAVDARIEAAMREFLAGNQREQRPAHGYDLADFGLSERKIRAAFS